LKKEFFLGCNGNEYRVGKLLEEIDGEKGQGRVILDEKRDYFLRENCKLI